MSKTTDEEQRKRLSKFRGEMIFELGRHVI